jgi:hypothetical protein
MSHKLSVIVLLVLVAASVLGCSQQKPVGVGRPSNAPAKLAAKGEPAVELAIDYGDGMEKRFKRIPHAEGMTVRDALAFAGKHPRGIKFESTGSGAAALLTQIDELANEGGGEGKNWLFRVNRKLASKSFDAYTLAPGDVILWKFEKYADE